MISKLEFDKRIEDLITIMLDELVSRPEFISGLIIRNGEILLSSGITEVSPTLNYVIEHCESFLNRLFCNPLECSELLITGNTRKYYIEKLPSKINRIKSYLILTIPPPVLYFKRFINHFIKKIGVFLTD